MQGPKTSSLLRIVRRGCALTLFTLCLPIAGQAAEPNPLRFVDLPFLDLSHTAPMDKLVQAGSGAPKARPLARPDRPELIKAAVSVRSSAAGKGAAKFDWLAPQKSHDIQRVASNAIARKSLGTGSWICSPAGFGKKSRCHRR